MTRLSKSPDRFNHLIDHLVSDKNEPDVQLLKMFSEDTDKKENDPEWRKNNLEYDLRTAEHILNKVRSSKDYAHNLYAALCNNEFIKRDMWQILKEDTWSCSWRYAGGVVADMREEGDYIDWYCGGDEGNIVDEIQNDLYELGWLVVNIIGE